MPGTMVNIFDALSDLISHQCCDVIIIFIFQKKKVKLREVK